MQLAASQRLYQLLHEKQPYHDGVMEDGHFVNWSDTPSPEYPFHWSDGASIYMAPIDLGLGGDFLGRSVPGGQQVLGENDQSE